MTFAAVICVEELFSARVPKSYVELHRGFIHVIKEVEDVGQQEQQGDKRDEEEGDEVKGRSRRNQKQRSQCAWNMKMTMGWTKTHIWAKQCAYIQTGQTVKGRWH